MLGNGKNLIFSSTIKENDYIYSLSTLTSLLVLFLEVFCTFSSCIYAGLISEELKLDSINEIPFDNSNLPFLTYLLALGMMKYNRFFSILFLFSLINFILYIPYTRFQGQFFLEWIDK